MAETGERIVEPARLANRERPVGKVRQLARRVMNLVSRQRPEAPALVDPDSLVEAARAEGGPSHAERVRKDGCLLRALMSAAGFALRNKHISAIGNEWESAIAQSKKITATLGEYRMRFKQIDQGTKTVPELNKDVMDLIKQYKEAPETTELSEALRAVDIPEPFEVESEAKLKKLIEDSMKENKQIIVFTPSEDPDKSHTFHAGVRNNHIIALSDGEIKEKSGKIVRKRFANAELNEPPYTVFTVTSNAAPVPADTTTSDLALAA
jgi:hypothetical protein